jgi:adenylate cyclase
MAEVAYARAVAANQTVVDDEQYNREVLEERVVPRRYEEVVVLFADIVGFTSYCDTHPPEEVVANLG